MIYLDNNATTPMCPEAVEAMLPYLYENFGNPSSSHIAGTNARSAIESARRYVADLLGADDPAQAVFTSGGTESNNWAIRGALRVDPAKRHIITTRVEHEAVRKVCGQLAEDGYEVTWLDVNTAGQIDLDQLRGELRPDTALVSVMWANNETGVIFPIEEIAVLVKTGSDALFHVDAVNAAGKVLIATAGKGIDLLSICAHKFHGPKGIGALYIRQGIELPSYLIGGGQELGRRAGTEAVHQIAGMGAAAKIAAVLTPMTDAEALRDELENALLEQIPEASVNSSRVSNERLPNTSNISFAGLNGELIAAELETSGVMVSTGSACHASTHTPSPVLSAMNISYELTMGSIRFSLSRFTTTEEIEIAKNLVVKAVAKARTVKGDQAAFSIP